MYNAAIDTGFLLLDQDGDHTFETGVYLIGAGSADDFSAANLVHDFKLEWEF